MSIIGENMFFLFAIFGLLFIYASRELHNTFINPFTVLCAPYMFVVVLNKILGERIGFYQIGNKTLFVIGGGLFSFFVGTLIASANSSKNLKNYVFADNSYKINSYNLKAMLYYSLFVTIVGLLKAVLIIRTMGFSGLTREGTLIAGLVGHLLFTAYPLQPFLLYYWLKNKEKVLYILAFVLFLLILFCSFVKYHIIGMIVICYLFVVITERKYLKTGAILLIAIVVAFFILNYVIDFISNNVYHQVHSSFYLFHLWKYLTGAVINGDLYYAGTLGGVASTGYKLMTFIMALPNMFIYAIIGKKLFPYESIRMTSVSYIGEESNVIDAISYMYSSKTGVVGVIGFLIVFVVFGIIMELLFLKNIFKENNLQIFISTLFAFFLFFSFFGTFYINSMPWEITVYSAIVPQLFNNNAKFRVNFK